MIEPDGFHRSPLLEDPRTRFFVVTSNVGENVVKSVQHSVWATQRKNEQKFNDAYRSGNAVILIFAVNKSGAFQGYARMRSLTGLAKGRCDPFNGFGRLFDVEWLRLQDLDNLLIAHLRNPLDDSRQVGFSRDGQELSHSVGAEVCRCIDIQTYKEDPKNYEPVMDEPVQAIAASSPRPSEGQGQGAPLALTNGPAAQGALLALPPPPPHGQSPHSAPIPPSAPPLNVIGATSHPPPAAVGPPSAFIGASPNAQSRGPPPGYPPYGPPYGASAPPPGPPPSHYPPGYGYYPNYGPPPPWAMPPSYGRGGRRERRGRRRRRRSSPSSSYDSESEAAKQDKKRQKKEKKKKEKGVDFENMTYEQYVEWWQKKHGVAASGQAEPQAPAVAQESQQPPQHQPNQAVGGPALALSPPQPAQTTCGPVLALPAPSQAQVAPSPSPSPSAAVPAKDAAAPAAAPTATTGQSSAATVTATPAVAAPAAVLTEPARKQQERSGAGTVDAIVAPGATATSRDLLSHEKLPTVFSKQSSGADVVMEIARCPESTTASSSSNAAKQSNASSSLGTTENTLKLQSHHLVRPGLGTDALSEQTRQLPNEQTAQHQMQLGPQRDPYGQAQREKTSQIPLTQMNRIDDADSDSEESTSSAYTDLPMDEPEEGEIVENPSMERINSSADVVPVGKADEVQSSAKVNSVPPLDSMPLAGCTESVVKAAGAEPVPREVPPQTVPPAAEAEPACLLDAAKPVTQMVALISVPSVGGPETVPEEVAAGSVPDVKGAESLRESEGAESGPNRGKADTNESDSSDSDAGEVDSSCLPVTDPYLLIEAE